MSLRSGLVAVAVGASMVAMAPAQAAVPRSGGDASFAPALTRQACPVNVPSATEPPANDPGGPPTAPWCALVTAPLHHADATGPTIQLAVAVFPATSGAPDAAPLFLLGGGPGEPTVTPALLGARAGWPMVAFWRRRRDVVAIDQRGVGLSRPSLFCPERYAPAPEGKDPAPPLRRCHDRLVAEGTELAAFNTYESVRDLDVVRAALGYPRVSLFGSSYGGRLAWQAERVFPAHLASVVANSPIAPENNWIVDAPLSFRRALDRTAAACTADEACRVAYPGLSDTIERVLTRLRSAPVPATTAGTTPFDDVALAGQLYTAFYDKTRTQLLPYYVTALDRGQFDVVPSFATLSSSNTAAPLGRGSVEIAEGAFVSELCAEEVPHADPVAVAVNLLRSGHAGQAAWAGQGTGAELYSTCAFWDVPPAPASTFTPFDSDVPTLVVTGEFDPITPPAYGHDIRRHAHRGHYVEVTGVGHSPLFKTGDCGPGIVEQFLDHPRLPAATRCLPTRPIFLAPHDGDRLLGGHLAPPSGDSGGGDGGGGDGRHWATWSR